MIIAGAAPAERSVSGEATDLTEARPEKWCLQTLKACVEENASRAANSAVVFMSFILSIAVARSWLAVSRNPGSTS